MHAFSIIENVVEVDVSTETGESLQSIVQVCNINKLRMYICMHLCYC